MKKVKTISYVMLIILAFVIGRYGIPLIQPTKVIYFDGHNILFVKNFPRTKKGRVEWWLVNKDWLKEEYDVEPPDRGYLRIMDFGTGFKVKGKAPSPFQNWIEDEFLCFPDLKLIANCLDKDIIRNNIFSIKEISNKNGGRTFLYSDAKDAKNCFTYSSKDGIIDQVKC